MEKDPLYVQIQVVSSKVGESDKEMCIISMLQIAQQLKGNGQKNIWRDIGPCFEVKQHTDGSFDDPLASGR